MIKASTKQPKAPVDGAGVGFFESKEGDGDEMVEEEEDPAMQAFLEKEKQFFLNRVSSEGEEGEEEAPEEDKEIEPELNAITPIQSHVEADTWIEWTRLVFNHWSLSSEPVNFWYFCVRLRIDSCTTTMQGTWARLHMNQDSVKIIQSIHIWTQESQEKVVEMEAEVPPESSAVSKASPKAKASKV